MSILIGADIVPTKSNYHLFESAEVGTLVDDELKTILVSSDYRIFNLEVPLTDREAPIDKCGPNLIAPTATAKGIKALGADLLTLANNHIMDQGNIGLEETIKSLIGNDIAFVGVGHNPKEAQKPYLFDFNNKRIGVYACVEREFSIVTEHKPGANPFNPIHSMEHISSLKKQCDYVIVLYHGGKEHYRYPSPELQKNCRHIIDNGADLVVCQHSHCVGCEEKYCNGTIVYGQGNFLFDHSESEFWQTSVLIQISETFEISYIPLLKKGNSVCLASGEAGEKILSEFEKRSKEILADGFIKDKYVEFANSMIERYLLTFLGVNTNSILWRLLNKLTKYTFKAWYINRKCPNRRLLAIQNFIECEAHRELLIEGLKSKINKI